MFAMAFSTFALPIVNAQQLIMNPTANYAVINQYNFDIDLNGPSSFIANVTLWVKYPGRADFTYIGGFPTTSSGDLDIYTGRSPPTPPFDFNETGAFQLKWALPPGFVIESNVETVMVYSDASQIPPIISTNTQFIYAGASPSTIGVGQNVLLVLFTQDYPPDIGETEGYVPGVRQNWEGLTFEVTKPDGTVEVIALGRSDPVGASYYSYTPDTVGTYYVQAKFPNIWKNDTRPNVIPQRHTLYTACESAKIPFVVQQEPIQPWPESPLPSGYWSRPVSSASREWYPLLGSWLGGAADQYPRGAYGGETENWAGGLGTETPHVLWTKPLGFSGGLMADMYLSTGFATDHYQGIDFDPLIVNGILYYEHQITGHRQEGHWAVDLYTGETLYYSEEDMPDFGVHRTVFR